MGERSRRKGADGEREIVRLPRAAGLSVERSWHTAQSPDATERACDVLIDGHPAQVKMAAHGFKSLYDALGDAEVTFLRADRREWLAVVPASRFFKLLREYRKP